MEAMEGIMQHLLFHKSILDNEEDGGRLDRYISLVRQAAEGRHHSIEDPWMRTTAAVLELVSEEGLDPWDIDLLRFTTSYRKHLRKNGDVDFITAGRLVNLAWGVLLEKTTTLVIRAEEPTEKTEDFFEDCSPWDLFTPEDPYMEVTQQIKKEPPLKECVYHSQKYKVGLLELMDAFEEARREADLMEEIQKVRERLRKTQKSVPDISRKLHKENIEEDIERVWRTVSGINKDNITMDDIFIRNRDEYVTVFVALLFLAKTGKVELKQSRPPAGKLSIRVLAPYEDRHLFGMEEEAISEKPSKHGDMDDSTSLEEAIEVAA